MPDVQKYDFSHQEIIKAMIKEKKIHEGIWGLEVKFTFNVFNFDFGNGNQQPASLVGVQSFSIARVSAITQLSVDAAVVNPHPLVIAPLERV